MIQSRGDEESIKINGYSDSANTDKDKDSPKTEKVYAENF